MKLEATDLGNNFRALRGGPNYGVVSATLKWGEGAIFGNIEMGARGAISISHLFLPSMDSVIAMNAEQLRSAGTAVVAAAG